MHQRLSYRRDIDGLRSLAILSVVVFHALPWAAPSGFAGVDIFFAISGYLIGGIIIREIDSDTFSFAGFYARRARRILPALLTVVAATLAVGLLLLSTQEAMMLVGSAIAAVVGLSNFFFWKHIDYFAPTADRHPLLMTWSLGVEEQFYVIFPILLICTARMKRQRLVIILALCAASLTVSVFQARAHPIAGFYLLPARIFELGLGAALAIVHAARPGKLPLQSSDPLAALGLAGAIASFYLFDADTAFPGFVALLPVLATVAILHTGDSFVNRHLLAHRLPVTIGLISYSWYLWHWPLLAYVRIVANGLPSDSAMLLAAVASLILAWASWRWIEGPFRRRVLSSPAILARYGVVLAATLFVLLGLKALHMMPGRLPLATDRIEAEIRGGETCMSPFGSSALPVGTVCRPQGAAVALIGDSHAAALAPGLEAHLRRARIGLAKLTKPSCSPLLGFGRTSGLAPDAARECIAFTAKAFEAVRADPAIRTVVLAGFWPAPEDPKIRVMRNGTAIPASGAAAIQGGLAGLIDALQHAGKRVIVVQDVPLFREDAAQYLLGGSIPLRARMREMISSQVTALRPQIEDYSVTRDLVAGVVTAHPKVLLVDLFSQICPGGRCRIDESQMPIFRDKQHLSLVGANLMRWPDPPDWDWSK